jgi:deoxyribodipyrimidine photo-lyase
MSKSIAIFIFHRDLRIKDNIGFHESLKKYNIVIPIFIYNGLQISKKNDYKSDNAIKFMVQSIADLDANINHFTQNGKLFTFNIESSETKIIEQIKNHITIDAVCFNIDYTPFAKKRTQDMQKYCSTHNIICDTYEDYLLAPMGTFNRNDDIYKVFTPFYRNGESLTKVIPKPKRINHLYNNVISKQQISEIPFLKNHKNHEIKLEPTTIIGGRKHGVKLLRNISKQQRMYNELKDMLIYNTTGLSPYIKFGCISIREVYWFIKIKLNSDSKLISQLYWREFYYYIINKHPKMFINQNFQNVKIKWNAQKEHKVLFKKWSNGKTGFPIVDAGMRELNETGIMHGRSRLITANFLTRLYGINWRVGEMYYARRLIDYDPAVNNGNWQWVASVGVDTKHHSMRIFNPLTQHKKFDPECEYVKKWVPELSDKSIIEIFDMYPDDEYKKMRLDSIKMWNAE